MKLLATALLSTLLVGCDLAPRYQQPRFILPDTYQGSGPFHVAHPDAELSLRGDWWTLFQDPGLTKLENQLAEANPTLRAAAEQYTQARDLAAAAESQLYPQVAALGQLSDNRQSEHRLFRSRDRKSVV